MKRHKALTILIILSVLVVAGSLVFAYKYSSAKPKLPTSTTTHHISTPTSTTGKSKAASKGSSTTSSNSQTNSTTVSPSPPSTKQSLIPPFGSFVSNHSPSLSNSSQSYELSSCETTPGSSCYIQFTDNSGAKIDLPSETTNSQGVTSWSWYVGNKGFTAGSWRIEAIATLNGQTKSTVDSKSLNVRP